MKKIEINKKIWCCIIAAEILCLIIFCFLYSRRETVVLDFEQEDLLYDSGQNGFYLDKSCKDSNIVTPEFKISKGMYTLEVQYEKARECGAVVDIQYADEQFDYHISDEITLPDDDSMSLDFRVRYSDRPIKIRGKLVGGAEEDYLLIRNICIVPAASAARNFFFRIVTFILVIDIFLVLYEIRNKFPFNAEMAVLIKIFLLLILFGSIPLFTNYLLGAHDLFFHLMRIEGIKDGWQNSLFPTKIQPTWLNGHGYAVSVFYGDLLLYIPAVLRSFGVSVQAAYKFYVVFINTITVLLAYYSFSNMSNRKIGLVCTGVYSLNIYRLICIYTRGAVGEYTAMAFMPLLLYGLWKVYALPEESKEHKRSWITIAGGCSGIFLSHMISTELAALFVILLVIVFWKKTLRRKTLIVLVKAVAATVCLNLWFLIPFLDYMLNGTYVINRSNVFTPYKMEEGGAFPAQFFMIDYVGNGKSQSISYGVVYDMPLTVGIALILVIVCWFIFGIWKNKEKNAGKKIEYFVVFLCVLSLYMTTHLFPYSWLVNKLPMLQMIVNSIQFPWRFFTISGVMITFLLCLILQKAWMTEKKKKVIAGVLMAISFLQGLSYMSKCINEGGEVYRYQTENIPSFSIGGAEYIPIDQNENYDEEEYLSAYVDQLTYDADAVLIADWYREKGSVVVFLTNNTEDICQIEVPLLLYKGYHAVADNGEELKISPGESYRISVSVPAGFSGNFRVAFKEPWYWRVCEMVSLLTLIGMISLFFYNFVKM